MRDYAIIYCRVSTDDQANGDRVSLRDQEGKCRAFAVAKEWEVVLVVKDEGTSGRETARLDRLLKKCQETGKSGHVVCFSSSRWGRFVKDPHTSPYYQYLFKTSGWSVDFANEPKTGNGLADAITGVAHGELAAEESREKGRRAKMGLRAKADLGYWCTREPLGYRRQEVASGRVLNPSERHAGKSSVKLSPGPLEEVGVIVWLFESYASGSESIGSLAREALKRWPRKKWSRGVVRQLLMNPAYMGDVVWGKSLYVKEDKNKRIPLDRSTWNGKKDAHPAIISRGALRQGTSPPEVQ